MKKIIFLLLYILSVALYYLILKEIIFTLNVFYEPAFILLMMLYLVFGYCLLIDNVRWQFIVYLLSLLTILFYRKSEVGFNIDNFYLWEWLKLISTNKIVMINIVGNILIFIPLGMYLRNIFKGFAFIIAVELLQVLFQRGMFDVVDIFLNMLGFIIGSLEVFLWKRITKKEKIKK